MDNQIKKFYDSESVGGGSWQKMYEDAQKEITRLNSKLAALQPSTLPLIETDENKGEFKSPHQIVYENFKGLGDAIEDDDLTLWYKDLIETCIEEYHKQFESVPLIDKGEQSDAVEFANFLVDLKVTPVGGGIWEVHGKGVVHEDGQTGSCPVMKTEDIYTKLFKNSKQ